MKIYEIKIEGRMLVVVGEMDGEKITRIAPAFAYVNAKSLVHAERYASRVLESKRTMEPHDNDALALRLGRLEDSNLPGRVASLEAAKTLGQRFRWLFTGRWE
jgi:hypothetical protein